jgi:hypothetical protein
MTEEIEKRATEFAAKKMRLDERRAAPEVGERRSRWSPGLLKRVSDVEVRSTEKRMVVRIEEDTGETVGWRYPDVTIGSQRVNITQEEAKRKAEKEVDVPEDAVFESTRLLRRGSAGYTYSVRWGHAVDGIPVEGDFLVVKINPETGEVTSVTKNWSVP